MNAIEGYPTPFDTPIYSFPTANFSSILTVAFFLIFIVWAVYTIIVGYHWFRYGHRSWLTVPALGIHVFVSGLLIFYIASGVK